MTINDTEKAFDFDEWCALAKQDPVGFENKRRAVIERLIMGSPEPMQERLRSLQWRVDMERARAKNANSACVNVYRMMWNRVYGESGLLDALEGLLTAATLDHSRAARTPARDAKTGDVLEFKLGNN